MNYVNLFQNVLYKTKNSLSGIGDNVDFIFYMIILIINLLFIFLIWIKIYVTPIEVFD